MRIEHLTFDVSQLNVGVLPVRSREYGEYTDELTHKVRYNVADHGNGIRLLVGVRLTLTR